TPQDAEAMLEMTGCDGVMIGRGALGNPWIFKRTRHYLETGELLPEPTASQRVEMARRHLRLLAELKGEYVAVREMRQHAPAYIKGFPGAAAFRARLVRCDSIAAYDDVFAEFLAGVEASGGEGEGQNKGAARRGPLLLSPVAAPGPGRLSSWPRGSERPPRPS